MPAKLRVFVIVIVIFMIAGSSYLFLRGDTDNSNTVVTPVQQSTPVSDKETTMAVEAGKYLDYDAELASNTTGSRILFFHAPWCPQCRELDASIKAGTVPKGTTIFKVDYDSNQKLRQQYGVTIQTTLVLLDDAGDEVKKYVAYDEPNLDTVIGNLY